MFDYSPNTSRPILSVTLAQLAHEDILRVEDLTDHEQIHIFMHRLHPYSGVTKDEMAMAVLSSVICKLSRTRLSVFQPAVDDMINFDCELPWGKISRSAIAYAKEPGIGENLFIATPTTLHGPQGLSCPKHEFKSAAVYDRRKLHSVKMRISQFDKEASMPELQFYLGITDAALPFTAHDSAFLQRRLAIISARAARLLMLSPLTGKQGSHQLVGRSDDFLNTLVKSFHIRPDRSYAPKDFVPTQSFGDLLTSDSHLTAGRAAYLCLPLDLPVSILSAALGDKPGGISAHEQLRCLKIIKDIDAAIEDTIDLASLKPAARKRQERKRCA
jgi:hypothetical protein